MYLTYIFTYIYSAAHDQGAIQLTTITRRERHQRSEAGAASVQVESCCSCMCICLHEDTYM